MYLKRKEETKLVKLLSRQKPAFFFSKFASDWLQITDILRQDGELSQEPPNYNTSLSLPPPWQGVPLIPSLPQWSCPWNIGHSIQLCKINCCCRHKTLFSGKWFSCKTTSNLKVIFGVSKQQIEQMKSTGHNRNEIFHSPYFLNLSGMPL